MSHCDTIGYLKRIKHLVEDFLIENGHPDMNDTGNCMNLLEAIIWQMASICEQRNSDFDEEKFFEHVTSTVHQI